MSMPEWYGRMPVGCAPLTDEFIKACISSGSLVPPSDPEWSVQTNMWKLGMIGASLILAAIIAFCIGAYTQ